jgi:hypothetical protein
MFTKFHYIIVNKTSIYKILLLPSYNTSINERREIGLQIADFQERKKQIKYAESIGFAKRFPNLRYL